jgi:CHAT domain-containing protein/Tfp pilus assembly protein PilF
LCGFAFPAAAQNQQALRLEVGKPIERDVVNDQFHSYLIELANNDFLNVAFEQRGVDITVTVYSPEATKLTEIDSPNAKRGIEPVLLIAEKPGIYRLDVTGWTKGETGKYAATLVAKRPATAEDREQVAKWAAVEQGSEIYGQSMSLRRHGRYTEALQSGQRALAIFEKNLGPEHEFVADALLNVSSTYGAQANYGLAVPLNQRGLALKEKIFGLHDPTVATAVANLGLLYHVQGDYARALPLYQRSLAIDEEALGREHPEVATDLNNLASLYKDMGDYRRAAPMYERALATREKSMAPEHPLVANALNNLGEVYSELGYYGRAAPLYQRALAIVEKVLGAEHPYVAVLLNNLAQLYHNQGDYGPALPLYERSLAVRVKALGPDHPEVAQSLSNLAVLYKDQRDFARAMPLIQRSLAIDEKALGPEHATVAHDLNNLAFLYQYQGDTERAGQLFKRALTIIEKSLGAEHPALATSLSNLATMYKDEGDYARAVPLLQRALAIDEKAFGPEHPQVATDLNNRARLDEARGNYIEAVTFQQRANAVEEKNITQFLNTGSERQKQLYLDKLSASAKASVSLNVREAPNNADASRLALTVILQRKGRALDATSDQIAALRRRATPEDQKLLDQLTAAQSQLATLQLSNTGKLSPEARRLEIARLSLEQERLQDAISRHSAEFRAAAQPVTLNAVRQALPAGAALVEIFVYQPLNAKAKNTEAFGAPRYVAYVLNRGDDVPRFADLGEAVAIDSDAAKFRTALQTAKTPEAQVKELGRKLDERVMRPVRKLLGSAKRIFLSPDGALNLVPFDAFVNEDGRYLIEDYSFNYLTSGRDLLRLQVTGQSKDLPTVVANPLFNMNSAMEEPASGQRAIGLLGTGNTANVEARTIDFSKLHYSPLAGTAAEAKSIGAVFPQARLWLQADATEALLKTVNSPLILHIATHGFFLPDKPQTALANGPQLAPSEPPPAAHQQENPMLRSGLILSGVKQRESGVGEDGVLTAQEAAGLNLFGTKLVVLSACETGLGDVQNGAGVYGLRRALVLAGSETQVMSLWQVSDDATRDLMIAYYTRLQAGAGRVAAIHQVQLAMLRRTSLAKSGNPQRRIEISTKTQDQRRPPASAITPKGNWRHPYYWAAFIPSGAWRTLAGKEPK